MIVRIGLVAAAAAGLAAFALRHPAPRATIQSVSVATPAADPGPAYPSGRHHRRIHNSSSSEELVVYVAGAVARPGLYHLRLGDRYAQAVASAGGLRASADAADVNLAQRAADGEEIYVPVTGEAPRTRLREARTARTRRHRPTPPGAGSVDVNSADAAGLAAVPGIGRAVASRIVELREREGSFASLDELLDVAGMTQSRLERARAYLREL
jgi:competence protein ComEA